MGKKNDELEKFLPPSKDLDAVMTPAEAASWLKLTQRTLLKMARTGELPCLRLNKRVVRFHPRTVLASLS